jgi:murein DD-endopeptidase MepM/ murein hydrolase activator NlpD
MALALVAVTLTLLMGGASVVQAQLLPPPPTTPAPPTTPPPAPPPTTVPPPAPAPTPPPPSPGAPAPAPTAPPGDDGDAGDPEGRVIPVDAQQVIAGVPRTPANDNAVLLDGARRLEALGVPLEEAIQATFGRFPIAGYAHWSDDWLFPRWTGPRFRHHLGCDVFAEYGTPLRAPIDGVWRVSTNALGGLSVKIVQPDGTFVYLAHLSAVPDALQENQQVAVGDVVGFVGDSGNARGGAPHLHIEVHPNGGPAVAPKPYLDQWVAEAAANLSAVLAAYEAAQPRSLVATSLLRTFTDGIVDADRTARVTPPRTELLFASTANPTGGSLQLAESSAASVAARIDWYDRELRWQAFVTGWQASTDRAWTLLTPLTSPVLRASIERHRPVLDLGVSRGSS